MTGLRCNASVERRENISKVLGNGVPMDNGRGFELAIFLTLRIIRNVDLLICRVVIKKTVKKATYSCTIKDLPCLLFVNSILLLAAGPLLHCNYQLS